MLSCCFFRKHIVETEKNFDFLKDLVANVPDVQPNEDEGTSSGPLNNINQSPEKSTIPRPRGRYILYKFDFISYSSTLYKITLSQYIGQEYVISVSHLSMSL